MRTISCVAYVLISFAAYSQKVVQLASPDGNIFFSFDIQKNKPAYNISYKGKRIIDNSSLGLSFADGEFSEGLVALKAVYHDSTEDYELVVGKTSHVHDAYKQVTIPLEQISTK